jgi:hypothetical protein
MLDNNCNVSLIVRLGIGTSPEALKAIINKPHIEIRFFTGNSFHPKFYIFGNRVAYVGSSNLTKKGLTTNQEVNIEIDSDENIFEQLYGVFNKYWKNAEPLNIEHINKFEQIINNIVEVDPFNEIKIKIGDFEYKENVGVVSDSKAGKQKFISNFRKSYHKFVDRYNHLAEVYRKKNLIKFPEIPVLIEVDKFLWWIRDKKAKGNSYRNVPIKDYKTIENNLLPLIEEFYNYSDDYLENEVVSNYKEINNAFSSEEKIKNIDKNELLRMLFFDNAFYYHARFEGGIEAVKERFYKENNEINVKEMICYLLFGKDEFETRLYNCIYEEKYYLSMFGPNSKKELFGLLNKDNIPINNDGIIMSMEWLGYGKL